jgi:hypothetical protein
VGEFPFWFYLAQRGFRYLIAFVLAMQLLFVFWLYKLYCGLSVHYVYLRKLSMIDHIAN